MTALLAVAACPVLDAKLGELPFGRPIAQPAGADKRDIRASDWAFQNLPLADDAAGLTAPCGCLSDPRGPLKSAAVIPRRLPQRSKGREKRTCIQIPAGCSQFTI